MLRREDYSRRPQRKSLPIIRWGQGLVKDGFEEAAAFGLGGGELRFQSVA